MAACWQAVKNEGNELFKVAHFADALDKYNQAIDLNPEVPTYYCNRTFRTVDAQGPWRLGLGLRLGAARHGRSSSVRSVAQRQRCRPRQGPATPGCAELRRSQSRL